MANKLIFLALFLLLIPMVSSFDDNFNDLVAERNQCIQLPQECVTCSFVEITTVLYPNLTSTSIMTNMIQDGSSYSYNFCSTNATGTYTYCMNGDLDGVNTTVCQDFSITPNGEHASVGSAVFYIGIIAVLVFFLGLCIYFFVTFDNLLNRVGTFGMAYLLIIAITFVAWNMAQDFLTSSPFMIDMFRILFWVFISGAFPLLVGAFAWYLIMLFRIREIERLMSKGFTSEEAERRMSRGRR